MIRMQGSWTVTVQSKSAAFAQRIVVLHENGKETVHPGVAGAAAFTVSEGIWGLRVEHSPLAGTWQVSRDRITFPRLVGGEYELLIRTDDGGGGDDEDFDDLVLACRTPATSDEYVIYGHATSYSEGCMVNRCGLPFLTIDTPVQLRTLLQQPVLADAIRRAYPLAEIERPGARFTPKVVPVLEPEILRAGRSDVSAQMVSDRIRLAAVIDGLIAAPCHRTPLAGYGLRFIEYDRTLAELAGAPYSGLGQREDLGVAITDELGNYAFRFTRTHEQAGAESFFDTASGEDPGVQSAPDVLVQIVDSSRPEGYSFETAPYRNIGRLRRIDLCVPASEVQPAPGLGTGHLIELVGNVNVLPEGGRLSAEGRVTTPIPGQGGEPGGLQCAAWIGTLLVRGEIGNLQHEAYTVRYRAVGEATWHFHTSEETRYRIEYEKIGPFLDRVLDVPDMGPQHAPYFKSTEDPAAGWLYSERPLKARLSSAAWNLVGPVEIRLDAYDKAGTSVKHACVTLYIDNVPPEYDITSIRFGGQPVSINGADCTLLSIGADPLAELEVGFHARDPWGFVGSYCLSISRCNEPGRFEVIKASNSAEPSASYRFIADRCDSNSFRGTLDDSLRVDMTGTVVATLIPRQPWLGATDLFTIIRVGLSMTMRCTDGQSVTNLGYSAHTRVFGVKQ